MKIVKRATVKDLELELWLRTRNQGTLVWLTQKGKAIPVKEMTNNHLLNAISYFKSEEEDTDEEETPDWYGDNPLEHIGDYDPIFDED